MDNGKHATVAKFSIGDNDDFASKQLITPESNNDGKYFLFIPMDWIFLPEDGHEVQVKNSSLSTVFLLLNTMIGSGIIVQAYVFREAGIIVAIFLYILVATLNYIGIDIIIRCSEERKVFDLSNLSADILGPHGATLADLSIVVQNAGALLSYILIIGTLLTEVVEKCSGWYCNIGFLSFLPIVGVCLPLCLIRNFGHLAIISYISIFVITATIGLVFIGGPIERTHSNNYNLGSFVGAIRTVGDIVFALGYITATFHSYNAMENKSIENFTVVSKSTIGLGAGMCFFTGLVGYLCFVGDTDTNVIQNFSGAVGGVFKTALCVHLILYIPGDFIIMRASLLKMFNVTVSTQSNFSFVSVTLACMFVITFVGIMLQLFLSSTNNLAIVVNVTGGIAGSVLYFVIPGLCGLYVFDRTMPETAKYYWRSVLLSAVGALIVVLVIVGEVI